jgi:hypothetical protein
MTCEDIRRALVDQEYDPAQGPSQDDVEVHLLTCSQCREWRASDERISHLLASFDADDPSQDFTRRVMVDVRKLASERDASTGHSFFGERSPVGRRVLALHGALAASALVVAATVGGLTFLDVPLPTIPSIGAAPPIEFAIPTFGELAGSALDVVSSGGDTSNLAVVVACIVGLIIVNTVFARRAALGASLRILAPLAFGVLWAATGSSIAAAAQDTTSQSPPPEFFQSVRETSDAVRILLLVLLSLGVGAGVSAVAILFRTYAANASAKVDHIVRERSGAYQLFIGACDAVLLFVLVVATAKIEALRLLSLLLIGVVFFLVALGFAARARAVGRDVLALGGAVRPELAQTLVGSGVLIAILLVPILGQILWLALLAQCLGTAFLGLLRRGVRARATFDEK